MPNPFLNNQFYFKEFSLAWVYSLIVKIIYFKLPGLVKQFYFS